MSHFGDIKYSQFPGRCFVASATFPSACRLVAKRCGNICLGPRRGRYLKLPEKKTQDVGELLDGFFDGAATGMSGFRVVEEKNRVFRPVGSLKPRSHFASVQGSDSRISVASHKECRGIFRSFHHPVVRGIGIKKFELIGVFRAAVFGYPIGAFEKFLVTQHVQERIGTHYRAEKLWALSDRRAHQKSAVTSTQNGEFGSSRVFLRNQIFRGRKKIIEYGLLLFKHSSVVPRFAELASAPEICISVNSTTLYPEESQRPIRWRFAHVEAAVSSEQYRI